MAKELKEEWVSVFVFNRIFLVQSRYRHFLCSYVCASGFWFTPQLGFYLKSNVSQKLLIVFILAVTEIIQWWYHLNVSVFAEACLDVMQTVLIPVMWAPICRTRQPRSSCPGWRLAEAEESRLNGRVSPAPWAAILTDIISSYVPQSVPTLFFIMLLNSP